jgi:hypothetical protein
MVLMLIFIHLIFIKIVIIRENCFIMEIFSITNIIFEVVGKLVIFRLMRSLFQYRLVICLRCSRMLLGFYR